MPIESGLPFRTAAYSLCAEMRKCKRGADHAMQAHLPRLGISSETIPAIERSYEDLLDILEAHFRMHPYILDFRPW